MDEVTAENPGGVGLQSLREQFRRTSVQVLGLLPSYVQTELTGPGGRPARRPWPTTWPRSCRPSAHRTPAREVLVESAKAYRRAERDGMYDRLFAERNRPEH